MNNTGIRTESQIVLVFVFTSKYRQKCFDEGVRTQIINSQWMEAVRQGRCPFRRLLADGESSSQMKVRHITAPLKTRIQLHIRQTNRIVKDTPAM